MDSRAPLTDIQARNYRFLQEHIYSHAGIVLEENKHYLIESRLTPIVHQLGLQSINDLCALLMATRETEVSRKVVEAMTTNETYFFRDPGQYDAIRTTLLPRLKSGRRDSRKLRFWSAAASTGQEAYSLAMLLFEEGLGNWSTHILGTDYASHVLKRAQSATYQQIEVNRGLPTSFLIKYFRRVGVDWQLNDSIRQMVHFEEIDLRESMRSIGPFDLVFCRNVLIYFDAETKRNVLKEIHRTLYQGAWLLLGAAETALGVEKWYERQTIGTTTVYIAR